jgi:hypothetical protein
MRSHKGTPTLRALRNLWPCILLLSAEPCVAQPLVTPVQIEGLSDCGDWLASRQQRTAIALQNFAIGMLNGLALGEGKEFWRADGRPLSRDAVYFSIDGYCRLHPTDLLITPIVVLFKDRTGQK